MKPSHQRPSHHQRGAVHSTVGAVFTLLAMLMFYQAATKPEHAAVDTAAAWVLLGIGAGNAALTLYYFTRKER